MYYALQRLVLVLSKHPPPPESDMEVAVQHLSKVILVIITKALDAGSHSTPGSEWNANLEICRAALLLPSSGLSIKQLQLREIAADVGGPLSAPFDLVSFRV